MSFMFLGCLLPLCITQKFGRRPIQLYSSVVIDVCLLLMGLGMMFKWNYLLLGTMAVFFLVVNMGPASISWIYCTEIATKKSVAVATTASWTEMLLVGLITKPLFDYTNYAFFVFLTLNCIMTVIIFLFMKETKGLSEEQVGRLYVKEDQSVVPLMLELP